MLDVISTLLLLLLIPSLAFGVYVSFTPPQVSPPKSQRKVADYQGIMQISMATWKCACWAHAAIEISLLATSAFSRHFPESTIASQANRIILETFLLNHPFVNAREPIFFPPFRMMGGLLILSGSLIRYWCFRELGRHFTFHIAILQKHELIKTGPYALVRHPSYTGAGMIYIGSLLWHGTPGAWARESKFYEMKISWVILVPSVFLLFLFIIGGLVIARPISEDEMLRKEFGKKWDQWAKEVPCRLIPGVY